MRIIIQIIGIFIMAYIVELFLPWWSIAIAALVGGCLLRSNANFSAGFLGIALLWTIKTVWIDIKAAQPLAEQVAELLMVKSKILLILITALLGGLVGGFASLTGSLIMKRK